MCAQFYNDNLEILHICTVNGIMHPGTYIPWLPFVAKVANLNDAQKVHGSQRVIPVYYKVGGVP